MTVFDMMLTGRMYYQGDIGINLVKRIHDAANDYHSKTGHMPNLAFVNPEITNLKQVVKVKEFEILVVPHPSILRAITWIGDKKEFGKKDIP